MSINCELLSLPLLFILQARDHDAGEGDDSQGLIVEYYHITTLMVPCRLHTSQHLKVRAGPESRVMSLAPVSPHRPVSPPYPHRPVFDVSGIMMSSVYCKMSCQMPAPRPGTLTTGPEAPLRKSKKKRPISFKF